MRSGEINSLDGAITMVLGGLGNSVFPRHCVQAHLDAKRLIELPTRAGPLLNTIYVARIAEATVPRRVSQVIEWFFEMVDKREQLPDKGHVSSLDGPSSW